MLKENFKENIDKKVTEKVTETQLGEDEPLYGMVKKFKSFSFEHQDEIIARLESTLRLLKLQALLCRLGMEDVIEKAIKDLEEEEGCPSKFKVGDKVRIKHEVFENKEYFIDLPKNVKETDIGIIVDIDESGTLSTYTYTVDFQRNVEGWGKDLKYWFLTEEELELI